MDLPSKEWREKMASDVEITRSTAEVVKETVTEGRDLRRHSL